MARDLEEAVSAEEPAVSAEGDRVAGPEGADLEAEAVVAPADSIAVEPAEARVHLEGSIAVEPAEARVDLEGSIAAERAVARVDLEGLIAAELAALAGKVDSAKVVRQVAAS